MPGPVPRRFCHGAIVDRSPVPSENRIKATMKYLTTLEAAHDLKVSKQTLLNWLYAGKIPEPPRNDRNYRLWSASRVALVKRMIQQGKLHRVRGALQVDDQVSVRLPRRRHQDFHAAAWIEDLLVPLVDVGDGSCEGKLGGEVRS